MAFLRLALGRRLQPPVSGASCTLLRRGPTPGMFPPPMRARPRHRRNATGPQATGLRARSLSAADAASSVANRPKYVNMADLTAPAVADRKPTSGDRAARDGEPIWDIIELLFFAYRDFVERAGRRAGQVRLRPRASPGAAFRQPQSRHEGRRAARHPARSPSSRSGACSSSSSTRAMWCRRKAPTTAASGCSTSPPKGETLAMKLAGLQTARIARALAELGPNAHEAARRFLVAMIDADNRDGVLRFIARADRARRAALLRERSSGDAMRASRCAAEGAPRRRAASAGGRRRPPHPRPAVALPAVGGLPRHHRGIGGRGARQARRPELRPPDPRRDDAGRDRLRVRPQAPHLLDRADPDADRARRGREPHRGAGDRRRRLCRQAVRAARTVAAHRQHPQARAAGRDAAGRVRALRRFRLPHRARRAQARRRDRPPHRSRARDAARCWRRRPARPCRASRSPATAATAAMAARSASAPSTCRSTGCAARSSAIPPIRCSCRPCAASATGWW